MQPCQPYQPYHRRTPHTDIRAPHGHQVLAQLLECRPSLSPAYESLFPPLLTPTMWERPGNIPALVRLICAYMVKGKAQVLPPPLTLTLVSP